MKSTSKSSSRHRIRFKKLNVERYFKDKRSAIDFRNPIMGNIEDIEEFMAEGKLETYYATANIRLLIDDISDTDYAYLARKIALDPVVRGALRPAVVEAETDIEIDYTMTLAEATASYLEERELLGKDMVYENTYYRFLTQESSQRGKSLATVKNKTLLRMRVEFVKGTGARAFIKRKRSELGANKLMEVLARVYDHVNRELDTPIPNLPRKMEPITRQNTITHTQRYSPEEIATLLNFWDKYDKEQEASNFPRPAITFMGLIIRLGFATAMRKKDISSLRWDEIPKSGKPRIVKRTKQSRKEDSVIPLNGTALDILDRIRAHPMSKVADHKLRKVWVFPSPMDAHNRKHDYCTGWETLFYKESAKLFTLPNKPIHAFRATAASILNDQGMGEGLIARQLACTPQNVKNYTRGSDAGLDAVYEAMDKGLNDLLN